MKALAALRRFAAKAWLIVRPLIILLLGFVIGGPLYVAIVYAIARVIDSERAEELTMDVVMSTSAGFFVLAPIGLAIYAVFRLTKRLAGRKLP